jgi:hypothetical protein
VSWNGNAKSGEENDAVFMTKVLVPLRAFARESGWSIIVLHHNSHSSNEYTGNASVAANTDGPSPVLSADQRKPSKLAY